MVVTPQAVAGLLLIGFVCWLIGGRKLVGSYVVTMVFGLAVAAVFAMFGGT